MKVVKRMIDGHPHLRPLLDKKRRASEHALGDAVEAWREQFNSGSVDNFEATNTYNNCRRIADDYSVSDELKRHADRLLLRALMRAAEIERDSS